MSLDLAHQKKEEPKRETKRSGARYFCEGTCKTCLQAAMHSSGILFCKSFHNFVHENGYCYRWESDKIEEPQEVLEEAPKKAKAVLDEVKDGEWEEIPF